MRVSRRAEARVLCRTAHAELVHVERANAYGASRFQRTHRRGTAHRRCRVTIERRARRCDEALDIDHRLHGERNARELAERFAGAALLIKVLRLFPGAHLRDGGERIDRRIACCNPRERCLDDLARGNGAASYRRCDVVAGCISVKRILRRKRASRIYLGSERFALPRTHKLVVRNIGDIAREYVARERFEPPKVCGDGLATA